MRAAGNRGVMLFLLRMAFWLGVVLILLPSGSQRQSDAPKVGAAQAISAASATVHDLSGFCARQPEACSVGSEVAIQLGYKAQAGAKMLYDFLTDSLAPRETGTLKPVTGDRQAAEQGSQDTLTPADLQPAWRGPKARKVGAADAI